MKYIIERKSPANSRFPWVKSCSYPHTYTHAQALNILASADGSVTYRITPAKGTLRQVTREEFLETFVDEAKDRLSFDIVHKYLPFPTRPMSGINHNHIVNDGVYPVQTERRTVRDGETLCGKHDKLWAGLRPEDCPGCLAIARGLAVRDLV